MLTPARPNIGPVEGFSAADFMASACASRIVAPAMLGSRMTARRWRSLIISSSARGAVTELMPKEATSMPRSWDHFSERTSLRAWAISMVWPGRAL